MRVGSWGIDFTNFTRFLLEYEPVITDSGCIHSHFWFLNKICSAVLSIYWQAWFNVRCNNLTTDSVDKILRIKLEKYWAVEAALEIFRPLWRRAARNLLLNLVTGYQDKNDKIKKVESDHVHQNIQLICVDYFVTGECSFLPRPCRWEHWDASSYRGIFSGNILYEKKINEKRTRLFFSFSLFSSVSNGAGYQTERFVNQNILYLCQDYITIKLMLLLLSLCCRCCCCCCCCWKLTVLECSGDSI